MKTKIRVGWLLAATCFVISCSMPKTHYYIIEVPHVSSGTQHGIARRVSVQRFFADHLLRDDRILYRVSANEVNFYEYHRWVSSPAEIVTNYFVHRLKDSGMYSVVSNYKDGSQPDLILQGRIHHFEEVDRGKEITASVALELELLEAKTRTPVWRSEANCSRPLPTRDVPSLVSEIYGCLDESATNLLNSMQKQVENPQ
jgi:ABC-type uncharacterized transport system auxiliary subunit